MTTIAQSISAFGYASVFAIVDKKRGTDAGRVTSHFNAESSSQFGSASLATQRDDGRKRPRAEGARVYPNLGIVYGTVDKSGLAALRADPTVGKVRAAPQLSLIRPVSSAKAGLLDEHTWGLTAIGVPQLWAQGLTGAGIRIAHLDTGVDATHPTLKKAVTEFAEFGDDGRQKPGATAWDSDSVDGHGTHTAATIAGRPVKGRHVGVAPGASLYSAMVIEGGDIVARILGGMDWAVGQNVHVLSMSLGIRGLAIEFLDIIGVLRDNGVLPVIAVGNEGPGTSRSPGNYPRSLSVGAHDETGAVAAFSSSQRFTRKSQPLVPDIVAPGVDVISAGAGGGWRTMSGSSMATPHIGGLAALLWEAKPAASVAQIERAIFASAARGSMDIERANRGAVNGPKALASLTR